ncbi:LuxR C-terminal-related transcriptional regulator [Chromohalobacter nigrandesensis]|uniref:LuxR C-terminal-related transcriptional regulator n=1 Tax=Chromohalobacter nigrandesensis TaxID=119863 RepID=UPI001FF11B8A|nr:LuxR C-terminal-related transcriptional regulator [Chromohalobacter nigrandesensis]MCK0743593.1 LuxR C-terminal-related transcriptional regulator [Chromohalobacter nigrandesensis]
MTNPTNTIEFAGYRCQIGRQAQGLPTVKQAQVIAGLAAGMTQKEIAKLRGVSPATIKSTTESLYFWLHASRATDAVAKAMKRGWIAPLAIALFISALNPHADAIRRPPNRGRQQISITARASQRDNGGLSA